MNDPAWAAAGELPKLTNAEFDEIRVLAHQKFGLDLKSGKEQLVSARLGKHLRRLGFRTFSEYCRYVQSDSSGAALIEMIDALTTNFTAFLREPAHFDFLRQTAIPEFRHRARIDIWSAACATGEEPYSIALTALEELGGAGAPQVRVLATDISTRALETARQGVYQADKFSGLSMAVLRQHFLKGEQKWEGWYRANNRLRGMVEFRRMNLNEPFPALPSFAVIFCRNVMIYFDRETQEQLIARLWRCLEPGGYLFTGHSESLVRSSHSLEYVKPAVYRRPREKGRPPSNSRSTRCAL